MRSLSGRCDPDLYVFRRNGADVLDDEPLSSRPHPRDATPVDVRFTVKFVSRSKATAAP